MTLIKALPLDKSTAWKKFQKLPPVLIAAKQDVVYTISEWYRDQSEPFFKGATRTFQIREFAFVNGVWKHVSMVPADSCNLRQHKAEFESMGFHVTLRTCNTIKELTDAYKGEFTKVIYDEFYLNKTDETLDVSIFCEGTICTYGYGFSIPVPELEQILIELHEIDFNSDGEVVCGLDTFDHIYDYWETLLLTDSLALNIIFTYLKNNN